MFWKGGKTQPVKNGREVKSLFKREKGRLKKSNYETRDVEASEMQRANRIVGAY